MDRKNGEQDMSTTEFSIQRLNPQGRAVTVIIGGTSKWRGSGANTRLVHGQALSDEVFTPEVRWGVGGALALKFAREGHYVVVTTRDRANAAELEEAIRVEGGHCLVIDMDVSAPESISQGFAEIRHAVGEPEVLIYNAGYMAGRDLPPEMELLEHFPREQFETALDIACRGPFLVSQEVLSAMRTRGYGTILFTNNQYSLRGRKRYTGQSLYYPRTMMRALAQALTEEYSPLGIHVANVVVDGFIDSPGTRALPQFKDNQESLISPRSIAEAFYYLHQQERSCWSHELQLTASSTAPSV